MIVFTLPKDQRVARERAIQLFARMRQDLLAKLPANCEVLHIGATAIPECLTKGDLDVVVRCDAAEFVTVDTILAGMFARNLGSVRSAEFSAFEDKSTEPECGVQLTIRGGSLDVFHHFLEALSNNPDLVEHYNELKRRFDGQSMDAYRTAKNAFVDWVLAQSHSESSALRASACGETG